MPRAQYYSNSIQEIEEIRRHLREALATIEIVGGELRLNNLDSLEVKNCLSALQQSKALKTYARNLSDAWSETPVK